MIDCELSADDANPPGMLMRRDDLGVLSLGDSVSRHAGANGARFLLIAGRPLNEPVARGGPFVMNTQREIREAQADYAAGRF